MARSVQLGSVGAPQRPQKLRLLYQRCSCSAVIAANAAAIGRTARTSCTLHQTNSSGSGQSASISSAGTGAPCGGSARKQSVPSIRKMCRASVMRGAQPAGKSAKRGTRQTPSSRSRSTRPCAQQSAQSCGPAARRR